MLTAILKYRQGGILHKSYAKAGKPWLHQSCKYKRTSSRQPYVHRRLDNTNQNDLGPAITVIRYAKSVRGGGCNYVMHIFNVYRNLKHSINFLILKEILIVSLYNLRKTSKSFCQIVDWHLKSVLHTLETDDERIPLRERYPFSSCIILLDEAVISTVEEIADNWKRWA